jgi:hypothetical protein
MLAHGRLCDRALLDSLARRSIELVVAVFPSTLPTLPRVFDACRDAGVPASAWPMLADTDGRWANASNAEAFIRFALEVSRHASEIIFDLEPPIASLRGLSRGRLEALPSRLAFDASLRHLQSACERLRADGVSVHAAALPLVLLDRLGGPARWQARLGTPVDGIGYASVSVMAYTTMIEGWSRSVVRRDDARAILHEIAIATSRRFGDRASISLGAVGTGAFGDEALYRTPSELADDVAVARAAGVDDLALFDLAGVVGRPPLDDWLDVFVATAPATSVPRAGRRMQLFRAAARIASRV